MKKILLFCISILSLEALDINEAVEIAILNNPSIKEKEFLFKSAQEQTNVQRAGFRPTLDLNYEYAKASEKNFVGTDTSSAADATLGYNLFNGFADKFNLKSQKEQEKAASYLYSASKADLKLQVHLAYINYLRSKEQIKVSQDTIKLLEQQLQDAKNFYEQGLFAKNDYLQVDVELLSAQQALLSSKRNVKISFYKLKRLLGSKISKNENIQNISRNEKDIIESILKEKMLENRSELKLLKAQNRAINYSYEASASNYYPKVDAEAKYEASGDDVIPNGGTNFRTNDQSTATINLSWNLYNGNADESNRASLLYQNRASSEQINDLYLELDFQLQDAKESYELARNQIKVATKALEQAKENFRITKNQYDENIANTTLMLDAQRFLARTQVDYYSAYFAMYDAMAQIERVVEEDIF